MYVRIYLGYFFVLQKNITLHFLQSANYDFKKNEILKLL
jgi:hypothetical protein